MKLDFQYKLDTTTYDKKPHRGETHSMAKLMEKKVRQIFALHERGVPQKEIAKKVKIGKVNVSLVLSGDRWGHVEGKRNNNKKPRLTKKDLSKIFELHSQGLKQKEIADELNTTQSTVSRVLRSNRCPA